MGTIPLENLDKSYAVADSYVVSDELEQRIGQYLLQQRWFQELTQNRKKDWIPGSKGGYPDYYGV